MGMCWAPGCNHYNQRETCKFFHFPKTQPLRNKWKRLVRRDVDPGPGACICSCHFLEGKRENLPTLFQHNVGKRLTFSSPEKRKTRVVQTVTASDKENDPRVLQDLYTDAVPSTSTAPDPPLNPFKSISTAPDQPHNPFESIAMMASENYFLQQELAEGKLLRKGAPFSFVEIAESDKLLKLYTGLPSVHVFRCLYSLYENVPIRYYLHWNVEKVPKIDQLFMCLMKLRQNFPHEDLALRFSISQATVTNIVITWVHLLHEVLFKQLMSQVPKRSKNKTCLPNSFSTFTNCRIVLDCTEMAMTVPRTSMATQKATYSSYKHRNTWKALVGVAPNGVVTFVSTLYPGSTSDKKIVQHCGILECLEGDLILADKGFLLRDALPAGVNLNIPPFLVRAQFTPEEVKQTETIAKARIHVERAIERMKRYKILHFIPRKLFEHAGVIVQVIGALSNLQFPLIKEVSHSSSDEDDNM